MEKITLSEEFQMKSDPAINYEKVLEKKTHSCRFIKDLPFSKLKYHLGNTLNSHDINNKPSDTYSYNVSTHHSNAKIPIPNTLIPKSPIFPTIDQNENFKEIEVPKENELKNNQAETSIINQSIIKSQTKSDLEEINCFENDQKNKSLSDFKDEIKQDQEDQKNSELKEPWENDIFKFNVNEIFI